MLSHFVTVTPCIEVTGSNIKRVDVDGPVPVQIITREQIERNGANTVAEIIRNIPSNSAASYDETFTDSFARWRNASPPTSRVIEIETLTCEPRYIARRREPASQCGAICAQPRGGLAHPRRGQNRHSC